jgi:protein tyrosine phosphatase (PTP) superfamily phosphohydrolase (DUF442 family)
VTSEPLLMDAARAPARPETVGLLRRVKRWAAGLALGLVAYLVLGNMAILTTSVALQVLGSDGARPEGVSGIDHLRIVDDVLWRGGAPSAEGYQDLLASGVTTIVDLRGGTQPAELDAVRALGFSVVHLPVNDGEAPSQASIDRLMAVVAESPGKVFVHCQAGVGRTGSVVAAYAVRTGISSGAGAALDNLAIGPPTLEQLAFTVGLDGADADRPPAPVVVASRVLDAPRQLWNRLLG